MKIRKITKDDKDEFLKMSREFYLSDAVLHNIDESYHTAAFEELMTSDVYLDGYIFEKDGQVAGYCLLNKSYSREVGGKVLWIEELYVRPRFQGRGIGSALLKRVEEDFPAQRYRLEVEEENWGAIKLYERHGYERLAYVQMIRDKQ